MRRERNQYIFAPDGQKREKKNGFRKSLLAFLPLPLRGGHHVALSVHTAHLGRIAPQPLGGRDGTPGFGHGVRKGH